jgi:hypothetical protein
MALCHAIDDRGDVSLGIEAVQLRALDQRTEHGGSVAATIAADEHKILAGDCHTAQQALAQIVVDAEAAVGGKAGQCFPAAKGLSERFAKRSLGGDAPALLIGPILEPVELVWRAARRISADLPVIPASIS